MQCPVCNLDLVMSERQGIEIDYCPKCRGVWLDRGELDKIIEKSQPRPAEAPSRPQERQYDHPGQGRHGSYEPKKHRKKSFLEELFD
jgi:Zn-finger nucleic acid-binding protein